MSSEIVSYLTAYKEPIGTMVNIVLAIVNIGVLWFIYKQFKRQGEQIENQKNQFGQQFNKQVEQLEEQKKQIYLQAVQFGKQSFQNAFFSLLKDLSEEQFKPHDEELALMGSMYHILCRQYDELKEATVRRELETYILDEKVPMPLTRQILHLVFMNLRYGTIEEKDAYYYAGVAASKIGYEGMRDYYFICAREYVLNGDRNIFNEASDIKFFETFVSSEDEMDKKIVRIINSIMNVE